MLGFRSHCHLVLLFLFQAHDTLSNEILRLLYDMSLGVVSTTEESLGRLHRLKRKDAQRAMANMEETVAHARAQEAALEGGGGLLIMAARWGDLAVREEDAAGSVSAPYIDVAVPLQCLVERSSFVSPPGQSCTWLEGFYDPSLGLAPERNQLWVRYKFLGCMHEAVFAHDEQVEIPMQEHLLPEEEEEALLAAAGAAAMAEPIIAAAAAEPAPAPGSAKRASAKPSGGRQTLGRSSTAVLTSSRATMLARQKARRRLVLYSTLALAGVSIYLLRKHQVSWASARAAGVHFAHWLQQFLAAKVTGFKLQAQQAGWLKGSVVSAPSNSSAVAAPQPAQTAIVAAQ